MRNKLKIVRGLIFGGLSLILVTIIFLTSKTTKAEEENRPMTFSGDFIPSAVNPKNSFNDYALAKKMQYELLYGQNAIKSGNVYMLEMGLIQTNSSINSNAWTNEYRLWLVWNTLSINASYSIALYAVDKDTAPSNIYNQVGSNPVNSSLAYITIPKNANNPRGYFAYDNTLVDAYPSAVFNPYLPLGTPVSNGSTSTPITIFHNYSTIKHFRLVGDLDKIYYCSLLCLLNTINGVSPYEFTTLDTFEMGKSDVLNNPNSYGLWTNSQYRNYGVERFNEGKTSTETLSTSWFFGIFNGISRFLNIKLVGNITFGAIILIPLSISVAWFVIRMFRGGGGD